MSSSESRFRTGQEATSTDLSQGCSGVRKEVPLRTPPVGTRVLIFSPGAIVNCFLRTTTLRKCVKTQHPRGGLCAACPDPHLHSKYSLHPALKMAVVDF